MILLSFDIEEFDLPLENQGEINFEEQIKISQKGLVKILDLLKIHDVKATFFSTVVFAENSKDLIKRLLIEGHELASHTYFHSQFEIEDLKKSRDYLENEFSAKVFGLRMPRMMPVPTEDVKKAGYLYNSSINPIFLPGRYNNFGVSRTFFLENELLQIPASVSPVFRIPLFWLSFHHFPKFFYKYLASKTLKKDNYLNIYFHPWEFSDIYNPEFKISKIVTRNSGEVMLKRLDEFIVYFKKRNQEFGCFKDYFSHRF